MADEVRARLLVWAGLMALLALTVGLAFAPIGPFRLVGGLVISAMKAALIYWVFMDLRRADGVTRVASVAAVFFLAVLMLITGLDFAVRAGTFHPA